MDLEMNEPGINAIQHFAEDILTTVQQLFTKVVSRKKKKPTDNNQQKTQNNLPTFHNILHCAEEITDLGSLVNYSAGSLKAKHRLIKHVKTHTDQRSVSHDVA